MLLLHILKERHHTQSYLRSHSMHFCAAYCSQPTYPMHRCQSHGSPTCKVPSKRNLHYHGTLPEQAAFEKGTPSDTVLRWQLRNPGDSSGTPLPSGGPFNHVQRSLHPQSGLRTVNCSLKD